MNFNEVKLIDPLSDGRWDLLVKSHPNSTIYQHSSWLKVLTLTYKHIQPLYFAIEDEKCNIQAALPCFLVKSKLMGTRIVSLPFSSYCDPIVDDKKDLIKLLDCIIREVENNFASYYELRAFKSQDLIDDGRLKSHNYHKIHILDIREGFEKVKRAFPKDIVKSQKKAIKSGLTVRQGCSEQDLKNFYVMHVMTRRRQGFPIQPYTFLKNMWDVMYPQGYFTLLLAELNKKVIAGHILFKFKDTVSSEIGAYFPKYLAVKPNHLLFWASIALACSEGYHYFDFGKSPHDHKGLLDFKRRWGAKMYDLPYFYYPQVRGMMSLEQNDLKHELLRFAGKRLPLPLAKIMGRLAYRHLG